MCCWHQYLEVKIFLPSTILWWWPCMTSYSRRAFLYLPKESNTVGKKVGFCCCCCCCFCLFACLFLLCKNIWIPPGSNLATWATGDNSNWQRTHSIFRDEAINICSVISKKLQGCGCNSSLMWFLQCAFVLMYP